MRFRATLERHLEATQRRDFAKLADTVASDGRVLIKAEGKLVRGTSEVGHARRGGAAARLPRAPVPRSSSSATANG